MRKNRSRPFLVPILLSLAACSSTAPHQDPSAHRAHDAYVAAINSNDLEAICSLLTDDVVFLCAGEKPLVGKAAVKPWAAGYLQAFRTHWDKTVEEFEVHGEWAHERYSWTSTDTPRSGGAPVRDTGWGLLLYHRDADGTWRVARDAWGPDHPPAPAK